MTPNVASLVAESLSSWPWVIALVALIYRRPIGGAIARLRRVKVAGYIEGRIDRPAGRGGPRRPRRRRHRQPSNRAD